MNRLDLVRMEDTQARAIGERLATVARSNSEQGWVLRAALMAFPSSGSQVWVPKEEAVAHWLDGQALVTATVAGPTSLAFTAHPTVDGDWSIGATFESAYLEEAALRRPGLKSHWLFRLPGGETFEVEGETVLTQELSNPNDPEILARQIAAKMLAS